MSAGWKVGDLALCLELKPRSRLGVGALAVGGVYTVSEVAYDDWNGLCLGFEEIRSGHVTGHYHSRRFRKIKPDAHESCEPEFVALLNRIKRPVSA